MGLVESWMLCTIKYYLERKYRSPSPFKNNRVLKNILNNINSREVYHCANSLDTLLGNFIF